MTIHARISKALALDNEDSTRADVEGSINDWVLKTFPKPPYTDAETRAAGERLYNFVYQQSAAGRLFAQTMN